MEQFYLVMGTNTDSDPSNIYLRFILNEAYRTIGLLDRDPSSKTFGCLDRTHWAWKFTDFAGARFQEGLCTLSFLFSHKLDDNVFYKNEKLIDWIAGGFDFWASIQYSDGSFDEAYPYERSLAATAFTSFYLSEAFNFLNADISGQCSDRFISALAKAGSWLCNNDEKHGFLSNHLAAAAAALYHAYRICEDERYEVRSDYFLNKILERQSTEGWYDEYGGADPGYQTHGSFYLTRLFELSGNNTIADSLERSFEFLAHFIHPDLSIGGEYASRNTQTYYPAAFEMMAPNSNRAHLIAATMQPSVAQLSAAGLDSVDAYNYFPLLNNYVFAQIASSKFDRRPLEPTEEKDSSQSIYFKEAGINKISGERFEAYIGVKKGGVVKIFDKKKQKLILNDCGYIGRLGNGQLISSQIQDDSREIIVADHKMVVKGSFAGFKRPVMTPFSFIGFRIFNLTFGRLKAFSYWLKSLLVKVLIYRKKNVALNFERRIRWQDDQITITDRIQGDIGEQLESLEWRELFTTIHMGSSRYFIPNELNQPAISETTRSQAIDITQLKEGAEIERSIKFKDN